MTSRFVLPFADVGSGITPSSGAQLFFFETDGATPKDTHTTKAATIANANPVIANSVGVFPDIYITGDYKITLKDKNGSQIFGLADINEFAVVADNVFVKKFDTLALAVADKGLVDGDRFELSADRGNSTWNVVLKSTVTISPGAPSVGDTVEHAPGGTPDNLALVLDAGERVHPNAIGLRGTGLSADRTHDISVLDFMFTNYTVIELDAGIYPEYKIVDPNLTIYSTKDVIFFLPDNTSIVSTTVAKMTLEIAAIGITINGDITVDGNESGNDRTAINTSDRRGAFAVNHDRFTLNGDVIVPTAYWVGVSLGFEGKIVFDVELERVRVLTASSYNFHAWACDRWKVGTIIVENNVQDLNNRIQTGTESAASTSCKNGEITTILALNTFVVIEINTVQLYMGNVICAGGKVEEASNVTIQSFISDGMTLDANGFIAIIADNLNIDNLTVLNYDGLQEEAVQFSGSSSDVYVGNITVTDTKERAGNPRFDLMIRGGNGLKIDNAVLKRSASLGGIGLFVNNTTSMDDVVIDTVVARGYDDTDVKFAQFNDPEIQINKVNSDATSNVTFTENVGIYDEQSANVALTAVTSGTITLSNESMSFTKHNRLVTVTGTLNVSSVSSPTGKLRVTGLVFAAFSTKNREAAASIQARGLAAGFVGAVEGAIVANTNYIELWRVEDGNIFDLSSHIEAGTQLTITVTYPIR